MGTWFKEVGRPALFDALAGACDQIDNQLDVDLKSYIEENSRLSADLESLNKRVSDVDRLEQENRSLKKELQDLRNAEASTLERSKHHADPKSSRTPLAPKSVNRVSNTTNTRISTKSGKLNLDGLILSELKEEYSKLDGNYTKLHEKYSVLEDAHAKLNGRLRDVTNAYNRWMTHAGKLNELCQKRSRTIKKLEAKLETATTTSASFHGRPSDTTIRNPDGQRAGSPELGNEHTRGEDGATSGEAPLVWPPTNEGSTNDASLRSTPSASPKPTREIGPRIDRKAGAAPRSKSCTSTQDTEYCTLPPLSPNRNTGSDEVIVKNEPSSDTPVIVSERSLRKRKYDGDDTEDEPRAPIKVKTDEDDLNPIITDDRRHFVPHESIDFDTDANRVVTPRKQARDIFRLFDSSPRAMTPSSAPSTEYPLAAEEGNAAVPISELQGNRSSALRPFSRNIPRPEPRIAYTGQTKQPSFAPSGLASLAEDGDQCETPRATTKKKPKTAPLRDLLDAPSPGPKATTPFPTVGSNRARVPKPPFNMELPPRRELPFGKNGLSKVSKTPQPSNTRETSDGQAPTNANMRRVADRGQTADKIGSTKPGKLRERPMSELGISDFKVNPDANEGFNFAFTDVVRGKDARTSLTGCVEESCCGQTFRLRARIERDRTNSSDFHVLLEKHLGDEAWKLSTMTNAEKEDMWLRAKTQELANEHGRHRHRFHRAPSPPGFWRTDFPSTQEALQDKEKSEKAQQQLVEQRYREAMRPGGRWLFRDE
ncbi:SAE2-domain-containing protein [Hypoxylon trugodes]|uniref:SAE2-domain-containing protein n=1 Tax=Hypoxylon trugodes TaxID=326681 RepID=UPI0021A23A0F|nr:SAE2-domain-containing protein [Hypoxylon trugodes]KAI1389453.1 SAE2-domain-containing protein [Hypoxylon trugodes]